METLSQLAQMQIQHCRPDEKVGVFLAIAETRAAVDPDGASASLVVAATPVAEGVPLLATSVEGLVAQLDLVEQLPPPLSMALGGHTVRSTEQEAASVGEMMAAHRAGGEGGGGAGGAGRGAAAGARAGAAVGAGGGGGGELEWQALACLRARYWDVPSATEMLRRYALFRLEFGLGTPGCREIVRPFVESGILVSTTHSQQTLDTLVDP